MKLRNVRRRQWLRHIDRLARLSSRLPVNYAGPEQDIFLSREPIILTSRGYSRMVHSDARRWMARAHHRWARTARHVEHTCDWQLVNLRINAAGDTRPGYECVHQLENGAGQCGSTVSDPSEVIGMSTCIVRKGGPGW